MITKRNDELISNLKQDFKQRGQRDVYKTYPVDSFDAGLLIDQDSVYEAHVDDTVSLIRLRAKNTDPVMGGSQLYMIKLEMDTDSIDTGSGVAIFNEGRSDSIYINLSGKVGAAADNSPTGIGIDLNKEVASSVERSSTGNQQGIQIFDWSTTNIGTGGPRGILLLKVGNLNTDHICQTIKANRNALQIVVESGATGYDATQPVVRFDNATGGATLWRIRAGGDQVFDGDGLGIQWTMATGNPAYILRSGTTELKMRVGSGGLRIVNNADTASLIVAENGGNVLIPSGDVVFTDKRYGVILVDRTTLAEWRLYVDGGVLGIES